MEIAMSGLAKAKLSAAAEVVRPAAATRVGLGKNLLQRRPHGFDCIALLDHIIETGNTMKQFILTTACVLALSFVAQSAVAQECSSCGGGHGALRGVVGGAVNLIQGPAPTGAIIDGDGRVQPQTHWIHPKQTLKNAARDYYSPNPVYAYSIAGLEAGYTHTWNQNQAQNYSWHGGYNTWRFGQPTATVVPPTASYQSSYAWGVGQTRSTPIHHQFGRGAGSSGGVGGGYQNTPYFPYSTNQFGYYPVRASW